MQTNRVRQFFFSKFISYTDVHLLKIRSILSQFREEFILKLSIGIRLPKTKKVISQKNNNKKGKIKLTLDIIFT